MPAKRLRKKRKLLLFEEKHKDSLCPHQQNDSFSGLIRLKTPAGTCSELHLLLRRWAGGSSSHWCKTEKEASHCAHICKIRLRCSIYAEVNGDYDYLRGEILCGVEVWGSGVGEGVPHCVTTQLKCHRMHLQERCLVNPLDVGSRPARDAWGWVQKGEAAVLHKSVACIVESVRSRGSLQPCDNTLR